MGSDRLASSPYPSSPSHHISHFLSDGVLALGFACQDSVRGPARRLGSQLVTSYLTLLVLPYPPPSILRVLWVLHQLFSGKELKNGRG